MRIPAHIRFLLPPHGGSQTAPRALPHTSAALRGSICGNARFQPHLQEPCRLFKRTSDPGITFYQCHSAAQKAGLSKTIQRLSCQAAYFEGKVRTVIPEPPRGKCLHHCRRRIFSLCSARRRTYGCGIPYLSEPASRRGSLPARYSCRLGAWRCFRDTVFYIIPLDKKNGVSILYFLCAARCGLSA